MLAGLLQLLLFQWLGHVLTSLWGWPIPGPVAGLVLLLAYLLVRGKVNHALAGTTARLLPFLPLFLIPASAGIIERTALLQDDWLAITIAILASTLLSFVATPFLFRFYRHLLRQRP